MRKLLGLLAILAVTGSASAQPPEVIQPNDQFELAVGEARILRFNEAFQSAATTSKGTAEIIPRSDKMLTVSGIAPGQTTMIVERLGEPNYIATITVTPSTGHLVKLYGHKGKDFIGWYCSEVSCGRADLDLKLANGGRDPDEPTVESTTVTQPIAGGGSVSHTQQFGR